MRAAIAGTFGFKLALHFLFGFGLLERGELALRKDEALLRHLRLERLQTEFHGGEIVPAPDGANPEGRDCHASFQELIGDTNLAEGRLFDGKRHDGVFDFRRHSVLQDRLASRNLLQGEFTTLIVKLLEPVEAVAAVAHHLASLADIAELFGQFEHAGLGANDFLILGHSGVLWKRHGGGCATPTSSAPAMAHIEPRKTPAVRLS